MKAKALFITAGDQICEDLELQQLVLENPAGEELAVIVAHYYILVRRLVEESFVMPAEGVLIDRTKVVWVPGVASLIICSI